MRRAMGPSVVYSTLIVLAVAVAFREPDRPRPGLALGPPAGPASTAEVPEPDPPPPDMPVEAVARGPATGPDPGRPRIRPVSAPAVARRPASDFTLVTEGERLADVSARVYGPGHDPRELWRANRDQLATPDEPLHVGMLLRTP